MKIKNKILIGVCVLGMAGNLSCGDFLDVQPKDKQTSNQVFSTKGGFYSVSNGIYNELSNSNLYGALMSYELLDVMGKRYAIVSSNTRLSAASSFTYTNSEVAEDLEKIWKTAYATIYNCNVVLSEITKQTNILTKKEASVMRGEMLALRAFLHFDMLRLFGPVYKTSPKKVSIPYNESETIKSWDLLPADSVINYCILRDLTEAETLLAEDPVISSGPMASMPEDGGSVQLRYRQLRMNYYSVIALKARVYLWAGDKVNALTEARKLIADAAVKASFPWVDPNKLLANSTDPDRVFSTEVFMGIYNKSRSNIYSDIFSSDNSNSDRFLQPRADYIAALFANETADYRFQSQWANASGAGSSGNVFVKFKEIKDPDAKLFYATFMPLIRLSEMYLIAAECEPVLADGYGWLNQMRTHRGLPEVAVSSASDLLSKIRIQYIRETWGEGQIFFMFKRHSQSIFWSTENGNVDDNVSLNATKLVPPIPAGEYETR